jgi:predicted dehydrogenase
VLRDLVHEIDYALALFGAPERVTALLEFTGPLDIESDQAANLLWSTADATVSMRLDYATQPSTRGMVVTSAAGSVSWDVAAGRVTVVDAAAQAEVRSFPADLDRRRVMARQALAALRHQPQSPASVLLDAGAPATLADGLRALRLCDEARADSARRSGSGSSSGSSPDPGTDSDSGPGSDLASSRPALGAGEVR